MSQGWLLRLTSPLGEVTSTLDERAAHELGFRFFPAGNPTRDVPKSINRGGVR